MVTPVRLYKSWKFALPLHWHSWQTLPHWAVNSKGVQSNDNSNGWRLSFLSTINRYARIRYTCRWAGVRMSKLRCPTPPGMLEHLQGVRNFGMPTKSVWLAKHTASQSPDSRRAYGSANEIRLRSPKPYNNRAMAIIGWRNSRRNHCGAVHHWSNFRRRYSR